MELVPVVEVVQVDGVGEDRTVVRQAVGAEDALAGFVGVDVAGDRDVELVDGRLVELHAGLLADPGLELGIGRLALGDELLDGVGVQAEGIDDHHVIAGADAGITGGELAAGFERNLEPEAGKVKNSQRAGGAGADRRNVRVAHNSVLFWNGIPRQRRDWFRHGSKGFSRVPTLRAIRVDGSPRTKAKGAGL